MDESLLKIGIIVILIYIICYLNDNKESSQSVEQQSVQKQQQVQQQRQQQAIMENFDGHVTPSAQAQQRAQQADAQQRAQQAVAQQRAQQASQQASQQAAAPVRAHVGSGNGNASVQQHQQQQAAERGLTGQNRQTAEQVIPQGVESSQQQASFQGSQQQQQKVDASGNVINTCGNDILTSAELLPGDVKTTWSEVTPVNPGGLESKNFLDAGFHIGINTVGQSMRNANRQIRSDPPIPKVEVSIWNRSTIESDDNRRPLEIGGACEN
jgi:hypothetical protein